MMHLHKRIATSSIDGQAVWAIVPYQGTLLETQDAHTLQAAPKASALVGSALKPPTKQQHAANEKRFMGTASSIANALRAFGAPENATKHELDAAYKKWVLAHHPDKDTSPGADARFQTGASNKTTLDALANRPLYHLFAVREQQQQRTWPTWETPLDADSIRDVCDQFSRLLPQHQAIEWTTETDGKSVNIALGKLRDVNFATAWKPHIMPNQMKQNGLNHQVYFDMVSKLQKVWNKFLTQIQEKSTYTPALKARHLDKLRAKLASATPTQPAAELKPKDGPGAPPEDGTRTPKLPRHKHPELLLVRMLDFIDDIAKWAIDEEAHDHPERQLNAPQVVASMYALIEQQMPQVRIPEPKETDTIESYTKTLQNWVTKRATSQLNKQASDPRTIIRTANNLVYLETAGLPETCVKAIQTVIDTALERQHTRAAKKKERQQSQSAERPALTPREMRQDRIDTQRRKGVTTLNPIEEMRHDLQLPHIRPDKIQIEGRLTIEEYFTVIDKLKQKHPNLFKHLHKEIAAIKSASNAYDKHPCIKTILYFKQKISALVAKIYEILNAVELKVVSQLIAQASTIAPPHPEEEAEETKIEFTEEQKNAVRKTLTITITQHGIDITSKPKGDQMAGADEMIETLGETTNYLFLLRQRANKVLELHRQTTRQSVDAATVATAFENGIEANRKMGQLGAIFKIAPQHAVSTLRQIPHPVLMTAAQQVQGAYFQKAAKQLAYQQPVELEGEQEPQLRAHMASVWADMQKGGSATGIDLFELEKWATAAPGTMDAAAATPTSLAETSNRFDGLELFGEDDSETTV
ncbi:MAG: hypothetical protein O3A01_00095 [bacterium]|nr:hypothetical protein [bacterium]